MKLLARLSAILSNYKDIVIISFIYSSGIFAQDAVSVRQAPKSLFSCATSIDCAVQLKNVQDENAHRKHTQFNRMRLNIL